MPRTGVHHLDLVVSSLERSLPLYRELLAPLGYGLHHLAFEAASRDVVDDCLRRAQENGLEIENEPREWHYMPGYYAGFFHDPDGIKLEIVHVP